MSDTLYLQLDQNIEVTNPHVYLQDIAALSMSNPKILNRLRVMPVIVLDGTKPGRWNPLLIFLPSEKRISSSPTASVPPQESFSGM